MHAPLAVFRSASGGLGTTSALPRSVWPSPCPLPEGEGKYNRRAAASGWLACGLAQQRATRFGWQPVDAGACGQEQDTPILAPGQICRQFGQDNTAQPFAIGPIHPYSARSSAEHVAL